MRGRDYEVAIVPRIVRGGREFALHLTDEAIEVSARVPLDDFWLLVDRAVEIIASASR